jgi:predicted amidohydrolase YtcJ
VGDGATETLFSLMRGVQETGKWPALRPRIEHGNGIAPDLCADALALGVVAVCTPPFFSRVRSLVDAGIPLALGSDSPSGNPFLRMMFATTRLDNPDEALTREQAVVAYTRGSAYAEKKEHIKGSLKPGMLADLAVLSQDIFAVAPQMLPETKSLLTVVDGEIVHSAGAFSART